MEFNPEQKISNIENLYKSSVSEMIEFRSTASRISFWYAGILTLVIAATFRGSVGFGTLEKVFVSISICVFLTVTWLAIDFYHKYYLQVGSVIKKCDEFFKYHDEGFYLKGAEMLPGEWRDFGSEKWREPIFAIAKSVLVIISLVAGVFLWLILP